MKNKVNGFLFAALVALSALACRTVSGQISPIAGGTVLFVDDFSDPESGWERLEDEEGSTDYTDGAYRIAIYADTLIYWANPGRFFEDAAVEVRATKAGGGEDDQYGIVCRHQDPDNFYALVISADGFAAIRKRVNGGDLEFLAEFEPVEAIRQGFETNHIRAECIGDRLTLYVNGELAAEAFDDDLPGGDVGLLAGTFSAESTEVLFDDFTVSEK